MNRRALMTVSGAALVAPLVSTSAQGATSNPAALAAGDRAAAAAPGAELAAPSGSKLVGWVQNGADAAARTVQDKARETVSLADFGGGASASAAVNLTALHAAMTALLDRFSELDGYYPGGAGDPTDFYHVNRQAGRILIPAARIKLPPNPFASFNHPRAPFVGFDFQGEGKMHSVLLMETGGAESWFYDNGPGNNRLQQCTWTDLGFRSDDYTKGNLCRMWSDGGPKQPRFIRCDFQYMQKMLETRGTGNADLSLFRDCTGHFYGALLTLDNDQSVVHNLSESHFGTYGDIVRVRRRGGGNVTITGGALDFIYHEDYSPAAGNFMFAHDTDANIGQGNCTFTFRDCRVEIEAYMRSAGDPPFGLVGTADHPNTAMPRLLFDGVSWVNGKTYTINRRGAVTGEGYRRIAAVRAYPRKFIHFRDCVLLKNFFYSVTGDRDAGSPNAGGVIRFDDCFDGVTSELPPADARLENLHSRVTYSGSAGRVITAGMIEHTTGSSFTRKLLDADPNFRKSFGREPASIKKICSFKHLDNGWPLAASAANDHYLDLPPDPGILALRIYILMPASGSGTNSYQLHLKINDRAGPVIASSTAAQFKDAHTIDLSHVDLSGVSRICISASGRGSDFRNGGIAYIEYV